MVIILHNLVFNINKLGVALQLGIDNRSVWASKATGKVEGWRINTKIGTGKWFPKKAILSEQIAALNRYRIVLGVSDRYGDGSASGIFVSQFSMVESQLDAKE